jgi:hypothetical protein
MLLALQALLDFTQYFLKAVVSPHAVTVRANNLTFTYLLKQARVRATFGDEIPNGFLFDAAFSVVKLHHPWVKRAAAVSARTLFNLQQNSAQAFALTVLVAAILLYVLRFVFLVIEPVISPLA